MKQITKPAFTAGTALHVPKPVSTDFVGCGEISAQPWFANVLRRDLMAAVNICRRDLKLSPSVLMTLDALLSCLPLPAGKDAVVTPHVLLTIYASNETLCFRAKGITDRQLRRHLVALEQAGLMLRRDSANGKRFPIMRGGKVIGAFGLDLTPLFLRAADILAAAEVKQQQTDELKGLRARIRHLCAQATDLVQQEALNGYYALTRRANLTLVEARAIITNLMALFDKEAAEPTQTAAIEAAAEIALPRDLNNMTGSAGHIVRHKKPESNTIKKERIEPSVEIDAWNQLSELKEYFPEPTNHKDALEIAYLFATMLGISKTTVTKALENTALIRVLEQLNKMARNIDSIHSPTSYLLTAVNRHSFASNGQVGMRQ